MENKVNEQQIAIYSEQMAEKLLNSFFSNKEKISGEEILNFSAIKQVNLFILKSLFQAWKKESKKLESPYFDYSHSEVIEAVEGFKNIVSRHILVDQITFKPILIKAISDALMLICSPYHFYLNELNSMNEHGVVTHDELKEIKKFTKINLAILEGLIANSSISGKQNGDLNPTEMLNEVVENTSSSPEDMETYITAFSTYVPLSINDIYLEVEHEQKNQESQPDTTPPLEDTSIIKESEEPNEFTVNESFASENQMSLADIHEQQKIESLSKGITLNQRFMFVNVLFDGDVAKFNNTVLEIDGLSSLAEAQKYINTRLSHWNLASQEAEEFMNILERRFS